MDKRHATLVAAQFGPQAAAYVASEVHAQGADLDQATALLTGNPDARVLDLGCGGGHVSFRAAPLVAEVVAFDLSSEMLSAVAQIAAERGFANVTTRLGAAEDLPFEQASFDFVISRYSAHHWHAFEPALAEAHRALRPGGTALFLDAVSPGIGLLDTYLQAVELLRDPSHVRDYSVEEWTQALKRVGFEIAGVTKRRVRLKFADWVARMRTPPVHIDAIRSLQRCMAGDVADYFELEPDGSFTIDTAAFEACRKRTMRVIGLAGWSGAGKTTLIVKLIPALRARGFSVSTLKHAHHAFDIDKPGKDSYLHREAGATEVLVVSANRWALMHELRGAPEPSLGTLLAHLDAVDFAIVEGFKKEAHAKIEVHRAANNKPFLFPEDTNIKAFVSDLSNPAASLPAHLPYAHLDDIEAIVALVSKLAAPWPQAEQT